MSGNNSSGIIYQLHPLVLINVSDHHTRTKAQHGSSHERLVGGLLGHQTGRVVEITNSFELITTGSGDDLAIDISFLTTKQEQYKKVFPTCDVIGWYSTGSSLQDVDLKIHKTMGEINEIPVFMLMNPVIAVQSKDLPITLYESEVHVVDGKACTVFEKAHYTIETVEAERISVDQIARILPSGGGAGTSNQLTTHLTGMYSAIKMLNTRIACITEYLEGVKQGTQKVDHELLRQIASLTRQLPAVDTKRFQEEFLTEYNDALLMVYLASMTKGTTAINDLADKFNVAFDKNSRRRALMG